MEGRLSNGGKRTGVTSLGLPTVHRLLLAPFVTLRLFSSFTQYSMQTAVLAQTSSHTGAVRVALARPLKAGLLKVTQPAVHANTAQGLACARGCSTTKLAAAQQPAALPTPSPHPPPAGAAAGGAPASDHGPQQPGGPRPSSKHLVRSTFLRAQLRTLQCLPAAARLPADPRPAWASSGSTSKLQTLPFSLRSASTCKPAASLVHLHPVPPSLSAAPQL